MDEFPCMLFKAGGIEEMHGGKFTTRIVKDQAELDEALAEGWKMTTTEAKAAQVVIDAPPTRAELEQKATELGIEFDGRTSEKKLAFLIEEKLKG